MKGSFFPVRPLLWLLPGLLAAASPANGTTIQELRGQIQTILNRSAVSGNSWSIYIENEFATTSYFSESPTTVKRPASVTKLFTTGAAFALLGPDYRFQTRIYHTGTMTAGTLTGDLHITAEHDFTWSADHYSNPRTPLNQIAAVLYAQGLRHITGQVVGRGIGMYDRSISRSLVAEQFREALMDAGIAVSGGFAQQSGFSAPGPLLHTWQSMRLDQACIPLNRQSVNAFADILLRHLGWKLGGSDSASAGNTQVRQWLESIGIDTEGFRLRDGSGLLWSNTDDTRISAVQSLELVRHMRNHYPTFETTLTVGCRFGTLSSRFCGTDASRNVYGKTGTLPNGQTASLAGYVKNPHDGQVYYFAFIANQATDITATRRAIDDSVTLLAQANLPNEGPLPSDVVVTHHLDPEASFAGSWSKGDFMGGYRYNYRFATGTTGSPTASATFTPDLPATGLYNVAVWYLHGGNRSGAAEHRIAHREGIETVQVDQRTGGGQWRVIAEELPFQAGTGGSVTITNGGNTGVVIADAVKFELASILPEPLHASPLLHYVFNEKDGAVPDYGASPAAAGAFVGGSTRVDSTPAGSSGRAFSTTSARGHLSGGSAAKLDRLEQFTLTAWLNLQAAPAHGQRILSRQGSGTWPGFSWGVNAPTSGTIWAGNFGMNLFVGGETGFFGQTTTADLSADKRWIFVAVTYDSTAGAMDTAFYHGDAAMAVNRLGDRRHLGSGSVSPTTFSFQVAGTAASTVNTAPFAWFDDIRIYDFPLTQSQLETVRQENLAGGPRLFEQWQREHFTVAQLSDESLTGPGADPGGAGLPNLLRYASGLTPAAPAAGRLPELVVEEFAGSGVPRDYLALRFSRAALSSDIQYTVQASSDLQTWEETAIPVTSQANEDGTITETHRDSTPISDHTRRFLRLEVRLLVEE